MKLLNIVIWIPVFLFLSIQEKTQTFSIKIEVNNQPEGMVVLGVISGDNFIAIDSAKTNSTFIEFSLNKNNHKGIYSVNRGHTPYAKLMKEGPHTFDFIFNHENIHIATDFKHPFDSLKVLASDENKLWYEVLRKKHLYRKQFELLKDEVDYFWARKDSVVAFEKSNEFNRIQMGYDIFLGQKAQQNSNLLVSKIISTYREPVLDGYLSAEERKELYKDDFFKTVNFSHAELINSSAYTDKIFEYLVSYNNPSFTKAEREKAYLQAVDVVLTHANKNDKVYQFIKAYLIHGFEMLQMQTVISYIQKNY